MVRLYLTNRQRRVKREILGYKRARFRFPYNDIGAFEITLPRNLLVADVERGDMVYLHYHGELLFTGLVMAVEVRPGDAFGVLRGYSELIYLAQRLALPEPGGNFTAQAYDVRSGPVESVVKGYVADNAALGAVLPERAFPFSVASDQGRGSTVTGRARFHVLLRFVQRLIAAAGDEMRMEIVDGVFDLHPVTDARGNLMFADWLAMEWGLRWRAPEATVVYAAGSGQGIDRVVEIVQNIEAEEAFWRVETFYDYRSVNDVSELRQNAMKLLNDHAPHYGIAVRQQGRGQFGMQYREGDLVTAQIAGMPFQARILEVVLEYTEQNGWAEQVGVGVGVSLLEMDALRQRLTAERLENLEVTV